MRLFGVLVLSLLTMLLGIGTIVSVVCVVMEGRPITIFAAVACFLATFVSADALDKEINR